MLYAVLDYPQFLYLEICPQEVLVYAIFSYPRCLYLCICNKFAISSFSLFAFFVTLNLALRNLVLREFCLPAVFVYRGLALRCCFPRFWFIHVLVSVGWLLDVLLYAFLAYPRSHISWPGCYILCYTQLLFTCGLISRGLAVSAVDYVFLVHIGLSLCFREVLNCLLCRCCLM